MKQLQTCYTDKETFHDWIREVRRVAGERRDYAQVVVHVFAECWDPEGVRAIRSLLDKELPGAHLAGTASFGNIIDGCVSRENLCISATIFEHPSSRIESCCLPLGQENSKALAEDFVRETAGKPWVKGIEALIMADAPGVTACCEVLSGLPESIQVFGGKSRFDHTPDAPRFVIGNDGELIADAAVFVLFGGEELHIQTGLIQGWTPLGKMMQATKVEGDILYELDGKPAYEVYYRYLHIVNDENFFFNTLEFPFLFYGNGKSSIRICHSCIDDSVLKLGATIPKHDYLRIAYGNSREILRSVLDGGREFEAFRPDCVFLYSCGCRHTYWGDDRCDHETLPFTGLAPTSGYYTAGELLRDADGELLEHNSTLVAVALREGDAENKPEVTFAMDETIFSQGKDTLISRFSYFVKAAIDDLEEANRRLESANDNLEKANSQLQKLSTTDGLTGLLNRREIERRVIETCKSNTPGSLLMVDLDDFKMVNDRFGHEEGDRVLQAFSALLHSRVSETGTESCTGRWGGEEFLALAPDVDKDEATVLAERIRKEFKNVSFPLSGRHTVSIGVTEMQSPESPDDAVRRADEAMYEAKRTGKNRVVVG